MVKLSNLIVFGLSVKDILKEHEVFYLFTYKLPSVISIGLYLIKSHLNYNIMVVYIMCNFIHKKYYNELDLLPDLDILSIAILWS